MTTDIAPIIVPLDGSKNAENALDAAKKLAAIDGATVHLLHVVEPDNVPTSDDFARARTTFTEYADGLARDRGFESFRAHLAQGKPAATILRYAREHAARAIVLASHGRGGFQATFIGSVADKVIRSAEVPVLMVPAVDGQKDLHGPILIAVDGSEEAEVALKAGRELAPHLDAKVVIISAYRMPPPVGIEFTYYSPQMVDTFREATEQYLAGICREDETCYAVNGSAAIAIVEMANQVDAGLVVMASHGKGLAERLALGSTTDRVMHSINRPLLVVPVGGE